MIIYTGIISENIHSSCTSKKYKEMSKGCFCLQVVNGVMVFNATFNNILIILQWSVLLVEETVENHWPVASHWETWSHNVVLSTPCHKWDSYSQH